MRSIPHGSAIGGTIPALTVHTRQRLQRERARDDAPLNLAFLNQPKDNRLNE